MENQNIILADDHPIMRAGLVQLIMTISDRLGISPQIDEVSGGVDLVKRVCSRDYNLAFTDISMPDLNGLEAIRQIRATGKNLPIYAISTHSTGIYGVRAIVAGATGDIQKGTDEDELDIEKAIRAHLL